MPSAKPVAASLRASQCGFLARGSLGNPSPVLACSQARSYHSGRTSCVGTCTGKRVARIMAALPPADVPRKNLGSCHQPCSSRTRRRVLRSCARTAQALARCTFCQPVCLSHGLACFTMLPEHRSELQYFDVSTGRWSGPETRMTAKNLRRKTKPSGHKTRKAVAGKESWLAGSAHQKMKA